MFENGIFINFEKFYSLTSKLVGFRILHIMELQCFEKKVMTDFVELFLSSISASKTKSEGTIVDVINK